MISLFILVFTSLLSSPTDPYPRNPSIDIIHYTFRLELNDTTDVIAKDLARRGIAVKQIGPYRHRAVELTRFVSETPSTTWLAIHVLRTGGKTLIFFVARQPLDESARGR